MTRFSWLRPNARTPTAEPAAFAYRVASLLRGGVHTTRTIETLAAEESLIGDVACRLQDRTARGLNISDGITAESTPAWRVLAAAWAVAEACGAPFAESLERISTALTSLEALGQRRGVLLAGPRSTVLLVSMLPLLAFVVGEVMGLSALQQLLSAQGLPFIVIGVVFLAAGLGWAFTMIRTLERQDQVSGIELDLLWIAVSGGHTPETALRLVADCVDRVGAEWVPLDTLANGSEAKRVLEIGRNTGAPVRALLISEAQTLRATSLAQLERSAERLGVKVLLPLGLCILPAFIMIGVIPVMMSMMTQV